MTTTMKTEQAVNGVDVPRLKETLGAVRKEPSLGRAQFRVRNRWNGGSRNRSEVAGFYGAGEERSHPQTFKMECDEPPVLLGDDQAANPVEYLLHGLAGCLTTTMVFHAAARGIRIDSVESTVEGDIDIRGFLGLADDVPTGFQTIRVAFRVESDAPAEKLAELAKFSPVFGTVSRATPVEVTVGKA